MEKSIKKKKGLYEDKLIKKLGVKGQNLTLTRLENAKTASRRNVRESQPA